MQEQKKTRRLISKFNTQNCDVMEICCTKIRHRHININLTCSVFLYVAKKCNYALANFRTLQLKSEIDRSCNLHGAGAECMKARNHHLGNWMFQSLGNRVGRARAQAASHSVRPGSIPDHIMWDLWWTKRHCFLCQCSFHQMLHTRLSAGAGTIGQFSGRRTKWTQSHPTLRN
jgi:hypothetical protein